MSLLAQTLLYLNSEFSVLFLWLRMVTISCMLNSEFLRRFGSPAKGGCAFGCQGQNVMSGKIKKRPFPITWESATSEINISSFSPSPGTRLGCPHPSQMEGPLKVFRATGFCTLLHQLFLARKEKKSFLRLETSKWYVIEGKPLLNVYSQ